MLAETGIEEGIFLGRGSGGAPVVHLLKKGGKEAY